MYLGCVPEGVLTSHIAKPIFLTQSLQFLSGMYKMKCFRMNFPGLKYAIPYSWGGECPVTSMGRDLVAYNLFFQKNFLIICLCLLCSIPYHDINPNHEYMTDLSPANMSKTS